jgi:hypothetical protein
MTFRKMWAHLPYTFRIGVEDEDENEDPPTPREQDYRVAFVAANDVTVPMC